MYTLFLIVLYCLLVKGDDDVLFYNFYSCSKLLCELRIGSYAVSYTVQYGSILKIDSTKKFCKKLSGESAKTASWAMNVGNEKGEESLRFPVMKGIYETVRDF